MEASITSPKERMASRRMWISRRGIEKVSRTASIEVVSVYNKTVGYKYTTTSSCVGYGR